MKKSKRKVRESSRTERKYGEFYRTITLPSEVSADAVEAEYMDGVLRVAVPKVKSANLKRVPIAEAKSGGLLAKLFSDRKPKEYCCKS
jgi:HSP20 family protein